MAKPIMIQGTMSNAGKSVLAAGLCRVLLQDGHSPAPFKSQNMALNSFITTEGLEMGRAQVMQAEAAGLEPTVLMNPILLKPTNDTGSQVIVGGEVQGVMSAAEYFAFRTSLRPKIMEAYCALAARHDIMVIEGAGSPAEINLMDNDIVNMGMAAMAGAPVLLAGDIDRGGVFASLYGTVELLPPADRARVRGFIINKFRGDVEILRPGLRMLEQKTGIPVLGVVPWLPLDLDDEDSLAARLQQDAKTALVDVAVVRLPHISNFTDFNALGHIPGVGVRYVSDPARLGRPDALLLPGTKNTMADLLWLRQCGLEAAVKHLAAGGTPVVGVCGGYQMLGLTLDDPDGVEEGGSLRGLELLPVRTVFTPRKVRTRVTCRAGQLEGCFAPLSGTVFEGYEIHMGRTLREAGAQAFCTLPDGQEDGAVCGCVMGSYVHGLLDSALGGALAGLLLRRRGLDPAELPALDETARKQREYDKLADALRASLDMKQIYRIIEGEA